jgi:hypothetical protein
LEVVIQILFNLFLDLEKVQQSLFYGQHTRFEARVYGTSDYGAQSVNNNKVTNAAVLQAIVTAQKMEFLIEQYKET